MATALQIIPVIALIVTSCGFLLALILAVRNRTIVRPRFAFSFRAFERAYPKLPRRFRKKRPEALFISRPKGTFESDLQVPIGIHTTSNRRIEGIALDLTYPVEFFLSNQELMKRTEKVIERFGEGANLDREGAEKFLKTRDATILGPSVRVRYDIGTLRPGEGFGFFEPFLLPPREKAFPVGFYGGTAFANVLDRMGSADILRAAFHLSASVLTDLAPRQDWGIDIVLCTDGRDDEAMDAERAYVNAYWFGAQPKGRIFRQKWFNLLRLKQPLIREVPVDLIKLERSVRVSEEKDGVITVATSPNPLESQYGVASLYLPGYDPRKLSDAVTTVEQGLLSIGYVPATWVEKALGKSNAEEDHA